MNSPVTRRFFFKKAGGVLLAAAGAGGIARGCRRTSVLKPNVVLINVDDLGWKDTGFMGSCFYETPHIDRLAAEGTVFTQAYAPAANCAPSRASMMTGLYPPRHGIYTVNSSERGDPKTRRLIPVQNNTVLKHEQVTIAERLREGGYRTCHAGKWHLGEEPGLQGFDINIGGCRWGHPRGYFSPYENPALDDGPEGEFLTDRLTDEAIRFIETESEKPFFLHLAYYAVHTPVQPKPEKVDKYRRKPVTLERQNPRYAALIESVDENIGRLLRRIDELGISGNTLIIFTSDNGGVWRLTSMKPLRAGKGSYYEGGIRVPLVFRWPGRIAAEWQVESPVSQIDILPTLLDACTGTYRKGQFDGISLMRTLTGEERLEARPLFWHFPVYLEGGNRETRDPLFRTRPGSVIRAGDWKLHEYFEDRGVELYNLAVDEGETRDLAGEYPEIVFILKRRLREWREEVGALVPEKLNPGYDSETDKRLRHRHLSKLSGTTGTAR